MRSPQFGGMTTTSIIVGVLSSLVIASTIPSSYAQDEYTNLDMPIILRPHMPQTFAETACDSIDTAGRNVVKLNLVGQNTKMLSFIKENETAVFDDVVLGPTLRATQGDVIEVQLKVLNNADFHPEDLPANFETVLPGEVYEYCFITETHGIFKYNYTGIVSADMDQIVLSRMHGYAIIDPLGGYKEVMVERSTVGDDGKIKLDRKFYGPEALEFFIQYNQLHLDQDGNYDGNTTEGHEHGKVIINGMRFGYLLNDIHNLLTNSAIGNTLIAQPWNNIENKQYQSQPLYVPTNRHVKLYIDNAGNEPIHFHVVGEIMDRITQGGRIQSDQIETWKIEGSQNVIIDMLFENPGVYAAVNHAHAATYPRGIVIFVVGDPFNLNPTLLEKRIIDQPISSYAEILGNPLSAVLPLGPQSIPHPVINIHGPMTDKAVEELKTTGNYIAFWEEAPRLLEKLSLSTPQVP